jgi:hypothetical protein
LNVLPGGFDTERVVPVQLSAKVGGVQLTTAWQDAFAFTVLFARHPDSVGAMLSTTVTLKEHVAMFPAASVAV